MQSFDKYTFRDYTDTDHYKYSNVTEAVPDASPICAGTTSNAALTESAPAVTRQVASSAKVSNASTEPDRKARPIGNGGLGPGYYWTQTLKEVTIHIDIDNGACGLYRIYL